MPRASRLQPRLLASRLADTRHRLDALGRRADASLARRIAPRRARLERVAGRLSPQPIAVRIARSGERLADLGRRTRQSVLARVAAHRRHLDGCAKLLASLSYHGVLQRGYALVRDGDGRTLRSAAQVAAGQLIDIELADGHVDAQALSGGARDDAKPQPRAAPRPKTGARGGSQGSLF